MNGEINEEIRFQAEMQAQKTRLEALAGDRKRAVFTVQKWLVSVGNAGMPLPKIVPDGIYGRETANAVAVFQGIIGLPQTGQTDGETWEQLRAANKRAEKKLKVSDPIYPFEYLLRDGRLREGDRSPLVLIVQIMIETLLPVYAGLTEVKPDGEYGAGTADNVTALQYVWQLPQTGEVDIGTWDLLARAYNKNLNRE